MKVVALCADLPQKRCKMHLTGLKLPQGSIFYTGGGDPPSNRGDWKGPKKFKIQISRQKKVAVTEKGQKNFKFQISRQKKWSR